MSRTPAKAFHSLLRTQFSPYVPPWGGNQMTLNSIYSLIFAVKGPKRGDDGIRGNGDLHSPIAEALWRLSSASSREEGGRDEKVDGIYTVVIKNEPSLRLLSCNTLKHRHERSSNSDSNIEVYTLLSSAAFGKQFKGPQENLPPELSSRVILSLLEGLERSLGVRGGSIVDSIVDLKLQLWGAAVPMNTWSSGITTSTSNDGGTGGDVDGFVYDSRHGVGACGDWILDSSIAGAWESGRRLANWLLIGGHGGSVGLPDRSSREATGKFVPSRAAESGIGTIPSSSLDSPRLVQSDGQSARRARGSPRTTPPPRRPKVSDTNGNNRRGGNNGSGSTRSLSR